MTELVRYDAMVYAIAECHSVDEIAAIHDKALALELYARLAMDVAQERKATEIRLRAERRTGELLRELPKFDMAERASMGGRAVAAATSRDATRRPDEKSPYREALERTGISKHRAARFQELARVPAETFEQHLNDAERTPSTTGILKARNGATKMDDGSLWIWGRLRDFEREALQDRDPAEVFGGMTATMQADIRRILPGVLAWLTELQTETKTSG